MIIRFCRKEITERICHTCVYSSVISKDGSSTISSYGTISWHVTTTRHTIDEEEKWGCSLEWVPVRHEIQTQTDSPLAQQESPEYTWLLLS